ncbi:CPBP family intramembrane glutamic endopeptidase [Ideonella sp.]|uniref:CPBP family intramembrane glutamic endopeptidase n=1 Tax=Ideonella sp. TaxID=1929293 RepID=UPI003BB77A50
MLLDLIFVAMFAVAGPLLDQAVFWPAHRRLALADPARARVWLWSWTMVTQWALVGCGTALWWASGRSFASLGFTVPDGWRCWAAIALCVLLAVYQAWAFSVLRRSADQRVALLAQVEPLAAMLPHTRAELRWFGGVSLTAGFCEEFLYRGYFIAVFAAWLGWWGAAALSIPFFAVAHLYQGWRGVLRTGVMGLVFTLLVATFQSLWPAIVLHALVDIGSGAMAWLVLRDKPAPVARR